MVKLASSLSRLNPAKILVLGDLILDTYTIGKARRISPEAPVAVVQVEKEESLPGGAGNVALNLVSLGAEVRLVGRCGNDQGAEGLKTALELEGIETQWILTQTDYQTPVKNRIIADNQQIVRIDHEQFIPLEHSVEQTLINAIPELMNGIKVVALSDYGKGFLSDALLQAVIQYANRHKIMVITDPKGIDFKKYSGSTIIKPNLSEAYAAANLPFGSCLDQAAEKILALSQFQMLMVTRSEAGISLFKSDKIRLDFPVHAKKVKDVTGAGDTVLAMLSLALANDLSEKEAVELCNVAAGIAIEHVGCARVTLVDLAERLLEKNLDQKFFDEDHLFVLKKVLQPKAFNLFILPILPTISLPLFQALQQVQEPGVPLLVYIADSSACETTIDLLCSLKEVQFILIHSVELKESCEQLNPKKTFLFANNQVISALSFNGALKSLEEVLK